jgi:hypothetical protein
MVDGDTAFSILGLLHPPGARYAATRSQPPPRGFATASSVHQTALIGFSSGKTLKVKSMEASQFVPSLQLIKSCNDTMTML